MPNKPKIITICGSSKFVDVMAVCAWLLEKEEGAIVHTLHLLPSWYVTYEECPDHLAEHEGVADQLDELHKRKIDISDEIFVVDINGYIGDSTRSEMEYTKNLGLPIRSYSESEYVKRVSEMVRAYLAKEDTRE